MSSIPPVSNTPAATTNPNGTLTQSQFYQIIVAQLQNQDPENATDTNAMVQDMMSLANYQATQQDSVSLTTMKNYITGVSLVGQNVDISVPASNSSAATTVSGTVTKTSFGNSGAAVTVNGTQYSIDYVTDVEAPTSGE